MTRHTAMLKALFTILIACLAAAHLAAQSDPSPAMAAQLADIRRQVDEMRGLDALSHSPMNLPSRAEVTDHLRRRFAREHTPESLQRDLYFYRALDLADAGLDLESLLLDFALEWIGGYYDLDSDSINIVIGGHDATLSIPQGMIYAHEWVHALQDQHFDLDRIIADALAGDRDRRMAIQALFEGDASLVMRQYLGRLLEVDSAGAREAFAAIPDPVVDRRLPAVIENATRFPYEAGRQFVAALLSARGWEGVNAALRDNPPTTTEQILHPLRYLIGEGAIAVEMPDFSAILGDGWRLVYDGTVGEFYLRQHLAPYIHPTRLDVVTTNGWGGDRLQVFADENDDLAWALHQVWDRPMDAAEFASDYQYALRRHYGRGTAVGLCFSGEAVRCVRRVGQRETRISQARDADMARRLLAADG